MSKLTSLNNWKWLAFVFMIAMQFSDLTAITFSSPVTVGTGAIVVGSNSVDRDAAGNSALAWTDGTNVYASIAPAGTGIWGAPVQLNTAGNTPATLPQTLVSNNGVAIVIWKSGNFLYFSRYANIGITSAWGAPIQIPYGGSVTPASVDSFSAAMNKTNANVVIIWDSIGGSVSNCLISYLPNATSGTTTEYISGQTVTSFLGRPLSIGIDQYNNFTAVSNSAQSFPNQIQVKRDQFGASYPGGTISYSKYSYGGSNQMNYLQPVIGFDNQYTVGLSAGTFTLFNNFAGDSTAGTALNNNVTSITGAATSTNNYLFYATSAGQIFYYVDNGTTLSLPIFLYNSAFGSPLISDLTASATTGGGVFLTWIDNGNIFYSYLTPYSTSFTAATNLSVTTQAFNLSISLVDANQGTVAITWVDNITSVNAVFGSNVYGAPPAPPPIPPTPGFQGQQSIYTIPGGSTYLSTSVDESIDGNAVAVWMEVGAGNVRTIRGVTALANQPWSAPETLTSFVSSNPLTNVPVLVSNAGNAIAIWYTGAALVSREKLIGQTWASSPIQTIATSATISNFRVDMDKLNGNVVVAYQTSGASGTVTVAGRSTGGTWSTRTITELGSSSTINSIDINISTQNVVSLAVSYVDGTFPPPLDNRVNLREINFLSLRDVSSYLGVNNTTPGFTQNRAFPGSTTALAVANNGGLYYLTPSTGFAINVINITSNVVSNLIGLTVGQRFYGVWTDSSGINFVANTSSTAWGGVNNVTSIVPTSISASGTSGGRAIIFWNDPSSGSNVKYSYKLATGTTFVTPVTIGSGTASLISGSLVDTNLGTSNAIWVQNGTTLIGDFGYFLDIIAAPPPPPPPPPRRQTKPPAPRTWPPCRWRRCPRGGGATRRRPPRRCQSAAGQSPRGGTLTC